MGDGEKERVRKTGEGEWERGRGRTQRSASVAVDKDALTLSTYLVFIKIHKILNLGKKMVNDRTVGEEKAKAR